ncbi:hypothetical protein C8R47DRAFT_1225707 [Mycena vitilis]|nr:hypothetical protein C8R47DRAFT_1225707 [Mycena vitilis]
MARAACLNNSDSGRHLEDIYRHIELHGSTSTEEPTAFLPVFYALLDPTPVDLTTHEGVTAFTQFCPEAIRALRSLCRLIQRGSILPEIAADLWPRMWIQMVLQHRSLDLPAANTYGLEVALFSLHLSLIRNLAFPGPSSEVAAIIDGTPGIRVFVTRIWKYFVHHEEFRLHRGVAADMDLVLHGVMSVKLSRNVSIPDLLEGFDGSLFNLTSLVLDHLDLIASDLRLSQGDDFPFRTISFLMQLVSVSDDVAQESFVSRGVVPKVVALAITLQQKAPASDAIDKITLCSIRLCHLALRACLIAAPTSRWAIQVVKSGLIWSLAHIMITDAPTDDDNKTLKDLLRVLSANLMYYSVIRCLAKPLAKLQSSGWVAQLRGSACWATWFEEVKEALARKCEFDNAPAPLRFCDNVSCDVVSARILLRRCSGCESSYYCSVACQRKDWTPPMDHKVLCPHLEPQGGTDLLKKDNAFLLHTIHRDYLRRKSDIVHRRAVFMAANESTGFYTQWNYGGDWNSPGCELEISIQSVQGLQTACESVAQKVQCTEILQRMGRERGRLEVDVVMTHNGKEMLYCIFVLRSNRTRLHDWTEDFARDTLEHDVGHDEYAERFDAFVAREADIVEIHSY